MSNTFQKTDEPPATLFLLKQRARRDIPGILEILHAHSYFGADVSYEIKGNKTPHVEFEVSTGPAYRIQEVRVDILPEDNMLKEEKVPPADVLGLHKGERAIAANIRSARNNIEQFFLRQGHVFISQDKPRLLVEHSSDLVTVVFRVNPGPVARYGSTRINGLQTVDNSYVRNKIPWEKGEIYNPLNNGKLKNRLMDTDLFSLIRFDHPDELDEDGLLPMKIDLEERSHRSLGFGLGYETDVGVKATAFWEHRNFSGQGEKLHYSGEFSRYLQEILGRYSIPEFKRSDQSLNFQTSVKREEAEAYNSTGVETLVNIEREITRNLTLGTGVAYKGVRLEDYYGARTFHLVSLPNFLNWDSRDEPLNPTRGSFVNLKLTPFDNISEVSVMFLKTILTAKKYYQFPWFIKPILAWRGKVGTISHESAKEIPADELFYAGGGGSIRGYPYQKIAPGKQGNLQGGLSLVETSLEVRQNITESIGMVMFLDGGEAYEDRVPQIEESFYWGTGLGIRYFTQVGPLRFDVAFPLDREDNRFRAYQIYISLGQSF